MMGPSEVYKKALTRARLTNRCRTCLAVMASLLLVVNAKAGGVSLADGFGQRSAQTNLTDGFRPRQIDIDMSTVVVSVEPDPTGQCIVIANGTSSGTIALSGRGESDVPEEVLDYTGTFRTCRGQHLVSHDYLTTSQGMLVTNFDAIVATPPPNVTFEATWEVDGSLSTGRFAGAIGKGTFTGVPGTIDYDGKIIVRPWEPAPIGPTARNRAPGLFVPEPSSLAMLLGGMIAITATLARHQPMTCSSCWTIDLSD